MEAPTSELLWGAVKLIFRRHPIGGARSPVSVANFVAMKSREQLEFGDGELFRSQVTYCTAMIADPTTGSDTSGQQPGSRRHTQRRTDVESIKSRSRLGHLIQIRRFDVRMTVVSRVAPTEIVRHAENEIWASRLTVCVR